jgi:hypothetical protein
MAAAEHVVDVAASARVLRRTRFVAEDLQANMYARVTTTSKYLLSQQLRRTRAQKNALGFISLLVENAQFADVRVFTSAKLTTTPCLAGSLHPQMHVSSPSTTAAIFFVWWTTAAGSRATTRWRSCAKSVFVGQQVPALAHFYSTGAAGVWGCPTSRSLRRSFDPRRFPAGKRAALFHQGAIVGRLSGHFWSPDLIVQMAQGADGTASCLLLSKTLHTEMGSPSNVYAASLSWDIANGCFILQNQHSATSHPLRKQGWPGQWQTQQHMQ